MPRSKEVSDSSPVPRGAFPRNSSGSRCRKELRRDCRNLQGQIPAERPTLPAFDAVKIRFGGKIRTDDLLSNIAGVNDRVQKLALVCLHKRITQRFVKLLWLRKKSICGVALQLRRCSVLNRTLRSSVFARLASGAFYAAIVSQTFYEVIYYPRLLVLFLFRFLFQHDVADDFLKLQPLIPGEQDGYTSVGHAQGNVVLFRIDPYLIFFVGVYQRNG